MDDLGFDRKNEVGKRRRLFWPEEKKREIVAESYASGLSVAQVARRHGLNANLLFTWRRKLRDACDGTAAGMKVIPVTIAPADEIAVAVPGNNHAGRMVIELPDGNRIVVGADVDAAALTRVLGALVRR